MVLWRGKNNKKVNNKKQLLMVQSGPIKIIPSNFQHIGSRDNQEDGFAFSDLGDQNDVNRKGVLAVVADGMGGLTRGEAASRKAVEIFLEDYSVYDGLEEPACFLSRTLNRANTAVYDLAFQDGVEVELGTTLAAVLINAGCLSWVSVGDSRIYYYHRDDIYQLTVDHVYANHLERQVEEGRLTRQEADGHPERGYLTGFLGLPEVRESCCSSEPVILEPGDQVLICSDGLYNTLSVDEIVQVLESNRVNTADKLGQMVLTKNQHHQDNVTVLVLTCC